MKNTILVFLMFFAFAVSAQEAGAVRSPEERAKMMSERMANQLQLSDEQKNQIYQNEVANQKELDELRTQMQQVRNRREEAMKGILNDEQLEKFERNKQDRREEMRERRQERRSKGNRPSRGRGKN